MYKINKLIKDNRSGQKFYFDCANEIFNKHSPDFHVKSSNMEILSVSWDSTASTSTDMDLPISDSENDNELRSLDLLNVNEVSDFSIDESLRENNLSEDNIRFHQSVLKLQDHIIATDFDFLDSIPINQIDVLCPLHISINHNLIDMVYYFYGRGCDIHRIDFNDDSPLELALRLGLNDIVNLFKAYDVNSISKLQAMNFLSFDDTTEKIILNPATSRLISSIPEDKKIYSLSIAGLAHSGKSFFLNALIIHLSTNGYLKSKTTDVQSIINTFQSSSHDRNQRVTEGSNLVILHLREGSEKWANGVIILFDFEGLGFCMRSHLSLYLSIATQISSTLIFMDTVWNDTTKYLIANMVIANMVTVFERDSLVTPELRVVLNKGNCPHNPNDLNEIYIKTDFIDDLSRESFNKEFIETFPNRCLTRFPFKYKNFDNASIYDIESDKIYKNNISPYFDELIPSLLSSPISINNIPLSGSAFSKYINDLINRSNSFGHLFTYPVRNFNVVKIYCKYHLQDCLRTFHYSKNRPKVSMCDGRNIDNLMKVHNELVSKTIERYLTLTIGISNWNIREVMQKWLLLILKEKGNKILNEHCRKSQILKHILFLFENQKQIVIATLALSREDFPFETSYLYDLVSNVSIYHDPVISIGNIKQIISNLKLEKVIPPVIQNRDFYREEEVPPVMGTRVIPAVYTEVDVPVFGTRDRKSTRHLQSETNTTYRSDSNLFFQNDSQGYFDKATPASLRLEEYVSGSESYIQSFRKEKRLVTPERIETFEMTAKYTKVIHEKRQIELAPSRIITNDLSALCDEISEWNTVAEYCVRRI